MNALSRALYGTILGLSLIATPVYAAQQTINIGNTANDATGDTLRNAFIKTNSNFNEVYGCAFLSLGSGLSKSGCTISFTNPLVTINGSIPAGDVVCGDTASVSLVGCGGQMLKTGWGPRPPNNTDDSTQNFHIGSLFVDTTPGSVALWATGDVTPNNAVWTKAVAATLTAYETPSWFVSLAAVAVGATAVDFYAMPGATTGANQNTASFAARSFTVSHVGMRVTIAPGAVGSNASQTVTFYTGPHAVMVATPVTCVIFEIQTSCMDTTHSAAVTLGQDYSVKITTAPGTAATTPAAVTFQKQY